MSTPQDPTAAAYGSGSPRELVRSVDKSDPAPGSAPLGLAAFLASLAVLFAATIVGYLVVRLNAVAWRPPGAPAFPPGLWVSTGILVLSSLTMHGAYVGARRGAERLLRAGMALTLALGVGFLVTQALAWQSLLAREIGPDKDLYGFTFFLMTGLHAAHVIGGLLPLAVTTVQAFRGRYGPARREGLLLCAMYWHFLDVVWLALFGTLLATG